MRPILTNSSIQATDDVGQVHEIEYQVVGPSDTGHQPHYRVDFFIHDVEEGEELQFELGDLKGVVEHAERAAGLRSHKDPSA